MDTKNWYSFIDEMTPTNEEFFALVEKCNVPEVENFLATHRVNINMKNYQGITPLHLAIQNDCEPLVNLFLQQKGIKITDHLLFAITHDNLKFVVRLLDYSERRNCGFGQCGLIVNDNDNPTDSEEFPRFMTPLILAAQCGQYETIQHLLSRGHSIDKPHQPRCMCKECCLSEAEDVDRDVITNSSKRLNLYQAISNPTYVCCTSTDPILTCFQLHNELLECGAVEQVYKSVYSSMAQQVRQFAVEFMMNCRTSDEVKILLKNSNGCKFKGKFPYPRLIMAMDYKQKEFVANTNVQQVLEAAWIGDWIEWKAYSTFRKGAYMLWRFVMLCLTVLLGIFAIDGRLNQHNRLPVNRMINSLIMYLLFLMLLFRQSNTDKFEMPRGLPDFVMWVPTFVFVLGHVFEKTRLIFLHGVGRYFKDMWNCFDVINLFLFITAYLCWTVAQIQLIMLNQNLARKYWYWYDPQLLAEGFFAIATVMAYIRLLFLCQLNYYIGLMQVSLGKILHDFAKFSVFMIIIMVAFTCGLSTLYKYYAGMVHKDPETNEITRQEDSFITVVDTFKTLFWAIFCMTSMNAPKIIVENSGNNTNIEFHGFTQMIGYGLFALFQVLVVIVMLNMLIAAMSDTFQRVADNADYEWLFGRTKVYVNYMLLDDLPPPFNLIPTFRWVILFKAKLMGYSNVDDNDGGSQNQAEFETLTDMLIQRYFTQKSQVN